MKMAQKQFFVYQEDMKMKVEAKIPRLRNRLVNLRVCKFVMFAQSLTR